MAVCTRLSLGLPRGPALPSRVCTRRHKHTRVPKTSSSLRRVLGSNTRTDARGPSAGGCSLAGMRGERPEPTTAGLIAEKSHPAKGGGKRALSGTEFTGSPKPSKRSPAAVLDRGPLGPCRETCGVSQREGVEARRRLAPTIHRTARPQRRSGPRARSAEHERPSAPGGASSWRGSHQCVNRQEATERHVCRRYALLHGSPPSPSTAWQSPPLK